MTKTELDALREKQREAQGRLDKETAEAKRHAGADEQIPEDVRERAMAARDEVVDLGEQIANGEKARAKSLAQNQEFLRDISTATLEAAKPTPPTQKRDGTFGRPGLEITRECVDLFRWKRKQAFGSSLRDAPSAFPGAVDPDAERLVLDMCRVGYDGVMQNRAHFDKRRAALEQYRHTNAVEASTDQTDALTAAELTHGGNLMPNDNSFMNEVQMAYLEFGGVSELARIINTPNGRNLPIPTIDDTAATNAGLLAENTAAQDVRLTFGQRFMRAYMITSGRMSATEQAIQDAGPTLPTLLGMLASERIQRKEAEKFISGDGSDDLQGMIAAFAVKTGVPSSTWDISEGRVSAPTDEWGHFIDIKYAVNAAYRKGPRFSMLMHDGLDQYFARAQDNEGRPIFREWGLGNTAMGGGMMFGGMNIASDYSIPAPTAATSPDPVGWVGDFNWFWIRRIAGMFMVRDPYTDAASFAINWVFGRRCDSRGLFNTGTNPAIKLIEATTTA